MSNLIDVLYRRVEELALLRAGWPLRHMRKAAVALSQPLCMSISVILFAFAFIGPAAAGAGAPGHGHNGGFSAGEPGNPKQPNRRVEIIMREGDGKMVFEPARIEVKRGEQIRFVLKNAGELEHEFVLATLAENRKHAEEMRKNPDMEHDDPNAKKVAPTKNGEILWRFTKRGEFEFACLIHGHLESGMHGIVIVK